MLILASQWIEKLERVFEESCSSCDFVLIYYSTWSNGQGSWNCPTLGMQRKRSNWHGEIVAGAYQKVRRLRHNSFAPNMLFRHIKKYWYLIVSHIWWFNSFILLIHKLTNPIEQCMAKCMTWDVGHNSSKNIPRSSIRQPTNHVKLHCCLIFSFWHCKSYCLYSCKVDSVSHT